LLQRKTIARAVCGGEDDRDMCLTVVIIARTMISASKPARAERT
jgi:hypothetical protein